MWIVYIIQHNLNKQVYIGKTNNLERRLKENNKNRQEATHHKSGQWILIYAEVYKNKIDANQRELKLKHHGSAKHELFKRINQSML